MTKADQTEAGKTGLSLKTLRSLVLQASVGPLNSADGPVHLSFLLTRHSLAAVVSQGTFDELPQLAALFPRPVAVVRRQTCVDADGELLLWR